MDIFRRRAMRPLALAIAALHAFASLPAYAALTDLASQPLANVAGTAAVKPNILYVLDDSGSMMQQYTPDYVSERWGTPGAAEMHCKNSGDTSYLVRPGLTVSDSNTTRDLCLVGDPPYMTPDFNRQYYNPEVTYTPPVAWDGTPYPSQNAANTANWTAVPTDGFGIETKDQLEASVTTTNLASGYPERVFCNSQARDPSDTTNCRANTGGYFYPDATFRFGTNGSGTVKRRFGAPYYYRILPGEYCTDAELTNCTPVALGGSPPDGYTYPAKVRWCTTYANSIATNPPVGACQARRVGTHTWARFSDSAPATVAFGSITIGSSDSDHSVTITNVQVNGVRILNTAPSGSFGNNVSAGSGAITAATGTNASGERASVANAIAANINNFTSSPNYIACAGNATTGTGCKNPNQTIGAHTYNFAAFNLGTVADNTVIVIPVDGSGNPLTNDAQAGYPIAVTAPAVGVTAASVTLTVTAVANPSSLTSLVVNGVSIIGGAVACNLANTSTNRNTCAQNITNAINSYTSTPDYTATRSNNAITISAPVALGSSANGFSVSRSVSGGMTTTLSSTTLSGGVSRSIPTTVTNIGAGADAKSTFQRINIVPTTTAYPRAPTRTDCTSEPGVCTYAEEMTNFANWYAYYRTRMQMMKTATGHAFVGLGNQYRLGFNTINNTSFDNSATGTARWLRIDDLEPAHKQRWYNKLYAQLPSGGTPLRLALNRAGRLYEGTLPGAPDPIQHSCQQNFTILTSDGYWNDSSSNPELVAIGDQDNVEDPARFCTRASGCYDGNIGAARTLADVALYYYYRDLRPGMVNNVPTSPKDPNPAQHMTTFTLGLGMDGLMLFREDYETATSGDFYRIRTGATGCAWTAPGATCNWPIPVANAESALDDMWHAAVNGRGLYFSAQDPASLSRGLSNALAGLKIRAAAAAASATSTPNVTQEDNDIFSATFRTVKWDGELVAQKIDTATGAIIEQINWSARSQLDDKSTADSDARTLYTADFSTTPPARKPFRWDSLTAAEQAYFRDRCAGANTLSQCTGFDAAQKALANDGEKMLNYLRGQRAMELTNPPIYRQREHILGDIASAKPAYVRNPRRNYGDPGYSVFKANHANRQAMVYVAANDGYLHALNASTGEELWAYTPHAVFPNLYKLADANYANNHTYYVDGSPEVGDAYINGEWRTILVGGLNKGGRGYYALDITEPTEPRVLWEFCHDAALCNVADSDLGFTYGNPIITKRPADGKWVVIVASGYNNVSPGTGRGYLYVLDAATGAILTKIDTGVGNTTTPSGLARITGRAENPSTDNTALTVFGGDLLGNLWRFDMTNNSVIKLASLTDHLGNPQPITTRPDVGKCQGTPMVMLGTGRYLGLSDLTDTQRQTIWGIRDSTTPLGALRGNNMVQQTLSSAPAGTYTVSSNPVDLATKNGWFVDLDQNLGERVSLDPQLLLGTLLVVTNQPEDVSACTVGGNSYKYEFDFCSGAAPLAASGVVGRKIGSSIAVGFIAIRLPSGQLKVISTFAGAEKTTEGVTTSASGAVRRVSWRELQ